MNLSKVGTQGNKQNRRGFQVGELQFQQSHLYRLYPLLSGTTARGRTCEETAEAASRNDVRGSGYCTVTARRSPVTHGFAALRRGVAIT